MAEKAYSAASLQVLSGLEPVRRRPGMYTDTTRPNHLIQEVVDNSVDEAIAKVNASDFGLQTGVFTDSVSDIWKYFEGLHVGGVIHNDIPTFRVDNMPFGGIKDSGFGREGIAYAIEDYTEIKHLALKP